MVDTAMQVNTAHMTTAAGHNCAQLVTRSVLRQSV